jgi:hypothetical protein
MQIPTIFIENNKFLYNYGSEYHIPYFIHMIKLSKNLEKILNISGICHHMMFETKYIIELFNMLETVTETNNSGASEYEIYFNYILKYHKDILN